MQIDYGLQMLPDTVLKIANTEQWLLQPELKAIKDGLTYEIKEGTNHDGIKFDYRGYLNEIGERHGVGITISSDGKKWIGQWPQNNMHQAAKIEFQSKGSYTGQ